MAHIANITYRPATIEQRPPDWFTPNFPEL
jgi:hypothetical protein